MSTPPNGTPSVAVQRTRLASSSFFGRPPQQIALLVHDVHAAVRRYTDVLGIGPWVGYTYGPRTLSELRYRGRPGEYEMKVALSQIDPQIELIEPVRGPSIYHDWMAEHGEGLHHVAYPVPSLAESAAELEAMGYREIQYGAGYGAEGDGAFAYYDTADDLSAIVELRVIPRVRREPEWRVELPWETA